MPVLTIKRNGVTEDPDDETLSMLSAVEETQLTISGALPRRAPFTSRVSQAPSGHRDTHQPQASKYKTVAQPEGKLPPYGCTER